MRDVNGWMVAALGATALVAAFFLGGRVNGSPAVAAAAPAPAATTAGAMVPGGIEFGCAPGQRVVMREGTRDDVAVGHLRGPGVRSAGGRSPRAGGLRGHAGQLCGDARRAAR